MSDADMCSVCDRPLATDALWRHKSGCECFACVAACWDGPARCMSTPVRWRERALAAEAEIVRLTKERDKARAVARTLACSQTCDFLAYSQAAETALAYPKPKEPT